MATWDLSLWDTREDGIMLNVFEISKLASVIVQPAFQQRLYATGIIANLRCLANLIDWINPSSKIIRPNEMDASSPPL